MYPLLNVLEIIKHKKRIGYSMINKPLDGKQKEYFKGLLKPHNPVKPITKEKIGDKTNRVLPIRGQKI